MKNSILFLILFTTSIGSLLAQDVEPSKNKFGVVLSTNIFGFDEGTSATSPAIEKNQLSYK